MIERKVAVERLIGGDPFGAVGVRVSGGLGQVGAERQPRD